MGRINVGPYQLYGKGEVWASLSEEGMIDIWIKYEDAPQEPMISITPERWDRLVAWIEWQRKEMAISKGEN